MRDHASNGRRLLDRTDEFDIIYLRLLAALCFQNMSTGLMLSCIWGRIQEWRRKNFAGLMFSAGTIYKNLWTPLLK